MLLTTKTAGSFSYLVIPLLHIPFIFVPVNIIVRLITPEGLRCSILSDVLELLRCIYIQLPFILHRGCQVEGVATV